MTRSALARRLADSRIVEVTEQLAGIAVRTFAYVGRVQIGDLTITIAPKIQSADLLRLLRYAFGLRDVRLLAATNFASGHDLLQDLLILQLVAEARELLSRGLTRRYVRTSEPLESPRGRIDVAALARSATAFSSALPCIHYPRSSDVLLNRVVGAGLHLAARLAGSAPLRTMARQTAGSFDAVAGTTPLDGATLADARRSLDRLVAHYASTLTLIELLHEGTTLSLGDGGDVVVSGCLFDMNRLFQALVTRLLVETLEGYTVEPEFGLREMMAFDPAHNPGNRRSPRPRPDLAVLRAGRVVQLLDAKYRDLWEQPLPRDMLYQLSIYALSQRDASTSAILYPTIDPRARRARIEIRHPVTATAHAWVELRPLLMPGLATLLDGGEGSRTALRGLAAELVSGCDRASRR